MAKPKPTGFEVRKSAPFNGKEWRVVGYEGNDRKQFWFATEKEAKKDAADRNQQRSAYGSQMNLDSSLRFEALKAVDLLQPFGKSILDAVNFYTAHLAKMTSSITVGELCDRVAVEFARRRASGEASTRHYTSMTETLRRFTEKFHASHIKLLDGSEIKAWLSETPWATKTRNRHLGYIKNIFGIAREWKLVEVSPLDDVTGFNDSRNGMKVVILTPSEMESFLTAVDPDWLPFFAISAFTGLRSQEVSRLDWSEIKLDRSLIDLPFTKSKNGNRKLEEIPANLLAILTPLAKAEGPVMPRKKLAHAMVNGARNAGIVWKQNCLRHSFCSYAVALKGLDWTAMQADHSTQMLKKNYLEVVSKEDAAKYWAISPLGVTANRIAKSITLDSVKNIEVALEGVEARADDKPCAPLGPDEFGIPMLPTSKALSLRKPKRCALPVCRLALPS
jgi:integrase